MLSRLLILDDVLSAVDATTERKLLETLRAAQTRPTTLLVSNRLSAVERADHIIVLDHGRIVDQGRHDELIERPGWYRDSWIAQTTAPAPESEAAREAG